MVEGALENPLFSPDDVRSVVFLFSADWQRLVLLERAAWKKFAPGRWTGIGGRLEGDEIDSPARGALRELQEETGIILADLLDWQFVADILDPGAEVRLVYFTAVFPHDELPDCNEGTLHWVPLADYAQYDLIDNTRAVLDALLAQSVLAATSSHLSQQSLLLPWHGVIQREAPAGTLRLILRSESA